MYEEMRYYEIDLYFSNYGSSKDLMYHYMQFVKL